MQKNSCNSTSLIKAKKLLTVTLALLLMILFFSEIKVIKASDLPSNLWAFPHHGSELTSSASYIQSLSTPSYRTMFNVNIPGNILTDPAFTLQNEIPRRPENVYNEGRFLLGWYRDNEFIIPHDFQNPLNANLDVYAKWSEKPIERGDFLVAFDETGEKAFITGLTDEGKSKTHLEVPAEIDNTTVTAIGAFAFYKNKELTQLKLPPTIVSIGDQAFSGALTLNSINLPAGLREIGYYAFENCTALKSINIPNTVLNIYEGAFSGTGLTSLALPDSVTAVPAFLAYNTPYLREIEFGRNVRYIEFSAFKDSGLTKLDLPASIREIGQSAFEGNPLTAVTTCAEIIRANAFANCIELTSLNLNDTVVIDSFAFANCVGLTQIKLPKSLRELRSQSFYSATNLTSVIIPSPLTDVWERAFFDTVSVNDVLGISFTKYKVMTPLTGSPINEFLTAPIYYGHIRGETQPPSRIEDFPGAWYNKLVSSNYNWIGIEGTVSLPQPRLDPARLRNNGRYADNSSVYMGISGSGADSDVGLIWEIINLNNNTNADQRELSSQSMAYRPFWRYIHNEQNTYANAPWDNFATYFFPGDTVRFVVVRTSPNNLTYHIQLVSFTTIPKYVALRESFRIADGDKLETFQFTSPEFGSVGVGVNKRSFKQVNAIDQANNENRPSLPTEARVIDSLWQTSYLLCNVDGGIIRAPLNFTRFNILQSPTPDGFHTDNALDGGPTSNMLTGFRTVDLIPANAKEYAAKFKN